MISRVGLRAVPRTTQVVARRFASTTPKKHQQGGFGEFGPFLKRECKGATAPSDSSLCLSSIVSTVLRWLVRWFETCEL